MAIFDYDGTLTPIVAMPEAARLSRRGRALLARLARRERAIVAIVSGRSLSDLRVRVAVSGVVYGGCHGLEIEGPGLRFRHPRARAAAVAAARRRLVAGATAIPGARVEFKRLTVSLHYRAVAPSRHAAVRALVASVVREVPDVVVVPGRRLFDFVPRVNWDKGSAVGWIVRRAGRVLPRVRPLVLYAGDDTSDEAAFSALGARHVTVRVGGGPTRAAHVVRGVREVHALLRLLVRATR
ncbi:MAG: trehalose-phosphatase [Candidatus Rokuibacteriota bacterium]